MPVHKAGPQLFHSIPFKHLAQVGHGSSGGSVNTYLNVTPFVDMMTILVTFLLMVFSASGEVLTAQKGLDLPDATNKDLLRKAPVIIITRDAITFNNEMMADPIAIMNDPSPERRVPELYDRLITEARNFKMNMNKLAEQEKKNCKERLADPTPDQMCLEGLAILQADKAIPAKVLNRVFVTAKEAGYDNLLFAVNRKGSAE